MRFYLDETGLEGGKAFLGIGGVCVINWQQYEKHGAALAQWRREQNWPEPIHFVEMGSDRVDRAVGLLAELDKRRGGLLFLGYVLNSRGFSHADLFSLFIQLVIDSLRALRDAKCLEEPRAVRIIKEAETGIDTMYLDKMHKPLSDLIAVEFPGRLLLHPIEPVVKGS
ncbi:MAG TPA: hypothetical protein VEA69_16265 [Tepidisphaeraceae bacterium]|nr:hypothetical protein [Tepidisphaeraceae bacterium]